MVCGHSSSGPQRARYWIPATGRANGPGTTPVNVLSISRTRGGVSITAGIHYGGANKPIAVTLKDGQMLSADDLAALRTTVDEAIEARKGPGSKAIHRPDEHWLQAILRQAPHAVGVEQPALRELPAWRPHDSARKWGRGYLDLLGFGWPRCDPDHRDQARHQQR